MTTPAEHMRADRRVQTDPWVERDVDAVTAARRIHAEQPEGGLLWVLAGSVTVHKSGRSREIRPGAVVSYRLGDALTWSAGEGARVRWSARAVRLEAGEVASWTADLALEVSPSDAETAPRRRQGLYATAAIAVTWIIALTVAWCYHQAQSARETGGTSTGRRTPNAEQSTRIDDVRPVFESFAVEAVQTNPTLRYKVNRVGFGGADIALPYVYLELAEKDLPYPLPADAFRKPADVVLARWPDMKAVLVSFAVKKDDQAQSQMVAQVAYFRGDLKAADSRSGGGGP